MFQYHKIYKIIDGITMVVTQTLYRSQYLKEVQISENSPFTKVCM